MIDSSPSLGAMLHSFFVDHLVTVKGLRPSSVRSYRDTIRLLLVFIAADKGCRITRLVLADLTFERLVGFLRHLEIDRHKMCIRDSLLSARRRRRAPSLEPPALCALDRRPRVRHRRGDDVTLARGHITRPGTEPRQPEERGHPGPPLRAAAQPHL